jgi:hypothetical protein
MMTGINITGHWAASTLPAWQQEMRKILSLETDAPITENVMQLICNGFRNWCKNEGSQKAGTQKKYKL